MTPLADILRDGKKRGRAAFIPYVTAGDPDLECTGRIVEALAEAGADIVELGVPFSDPIADGPVNQRAAERALKARTTLAGILEAVENLREAGCAVPIVLFTYYNPVFRMGLGSFAARAKRAGVQGVLTVDLPPEEAREYCEALARAGLEAVFLASPTTTNERLRAIDRAATGFVYYVSRLGVTGTRQDLPSALEKDLARVRRFVKKPVAVGFGISTPEQARAVSRLADGVVVGSALVKLIEDHDAPEAVRRVRELASEMTTAMGERP